MIRSLLLGLLALASLGAFAPVPLAAGACPGTSIYCRGTTEVVPGDQGSRNCPYDDNTGSSGGGAFDQTQGTNRIDFRFLDVQLAAADTFWFEGPVQGDSVKCRALLDINARACSGDRASVRATFALAPGYTQTYALFAPSPAECRDGSATYNQLVALRVGEKFLMTLELRSFEAAGGDGFIATVLRFDQLPPGVSVRSCHGFRQDGPVPAVRDSWGAIKAIYRR